MIIKYKKKYLLEKLERGVTTKIDDGWESFNSR